MSFAFVSLVNANHSYYDYSSEKVQAQTASIENNFPYFIVYNYDTGCVEIHFYNFTTYTTTTKVLLFDINGRCVFQKDVIVAPGIVVSIPMSLLQTGVYLLAIQHMPYTYWDKIIISAKSL